MNVPLRNLALSSVTLEDKYAQDTGSWYMTGSQVLVKIPLLQRALDVRNGLNTGGFISGYRGSPLSGYDQQLWRAGKHLAARNIQFVPGVNEELAATAVWGSQQVNLHSGAKVDGVFGIYYAKKMGIDRSGDALHHANASGTSPLGGVLALSGDDHAARSASLACQSELVFSAAMIPTLNPATLQDYLEFGLHGIAMSRYSGVWSAMAVLAETVDGSASVNFDFDTFSIATPDDYEPPSGGLHIRWPDPVLMQEDRLMRHRMFAVQAYARANNLNKVILDPPNARFGIVTTGKSHLDVRKALSQLNIDERVAARIGLRLMKVGLIWPLEPQAMLRFSSGLDEVLVVEEKRPTIETQLKELLFNETIRPRVIGKTAKGSVWSTSADDWLLPPTFELSADLIARTIANRLLAFGVDEEVEALLRNYLRRDEADTAAQAEIVALSIDPGRSASDNKNAIVTPGARSPFYCSGCPHNTSTRVPEGSRAIAGIGCHFMAMWIYPEQTATFAQMGGEGATWVGQSAFTDTKHVFVNLGDGTYYHSGLLAIRQAISAKVNITYKILYNNAVAMTGGQPVEGGLTVEQIVGELLMEGVAKLVVVSDDPEKYNRAMLRDIEIFHRDDLDAVQRDIRDVEGCTVIVYDQTCAAEKRRRRKRNEYPDPAKRLVINQSVCEGCGDCSVQSNCISIVPVETDLGVKRAIDQSSCNKDYSCAKGFCPSFVTVTGGGLRKRTGVVNTDDVNLPAPQLPSLDSPRRILVAGIGGTGVITIGALVGMAAQIDGSFASILDMTGLAQKGGAVFCHIQIAKTQDEVHGARLKIADTLVVCEVTTALEPTALGVLRRGVTRAFVNPEVVQAVAAKDQAGGRSDSNAIAERLKRMLGGERVEQVDASWLAVQLLGDTIFANSIMLGYVWQRGELPLSLEAILRAMELNGVAIEKSKAAFGWGRRAALDIEGVIARAEEIGGPRIDRTPPTTEAKLESYRDHMRKYGGSRFEKRFNRLAERIIAADLRVNGEMGPFSEAGFLAAVRSLAIKDEFEVARLLTEPAFLNKIRRDFEGDIKLTFNLAPPAFAGVDPKSGEARKKEYSERIMLPALRALSAARRVRGTWLDPFRWTTDRAEQVEEANRFEAHLAILTEGLSGATYDDAVRYLKLADRIRGYGHVRKRNAESVRQEQDALVSKVANHKQAVA
ncbi:MAG: indolepyruvate ferredoxin oxidoreductase family protein [Rhizobiaceae bacterium]|nr:indolepyruvate ferredoxin oxidoreductase family protein [Rhizobiaceae bacterium]